MTTEDYQHTTPADLAENISEIGSVIKSIHEHRIRLLAQLGLLPQNLHSDKPISNKGYFYLYNCEPRIENVMPKVASLDEEAMEGVGRELSYAVLTTEEQYTIAGALCGVAFIRAVTSNKVALAAELLPKLGPDDRITVFSPAYKEKNSFISQPLILTALMVADIRCPEMFAMLLDRVDFNSTISWRAFSFTSQLMEEKSAVLGAALLSKTITERGEEVAVTLIERNPSLIKLPSIKGNDCLLTFMVGEGRVGILDKLKDEAKGNVKALAEELLPELEKGAQLAPEYIKLIKEWCERTMPDKAGVHLDKPRSLTRARLVYLFMTPLAFIGGVAFSGVGSQYMKDMLAGAGIPTGLIPAALIVLVISGISTILMERYSGVLDRATAVSLILSTVATLLPGVPGGPKTQESLQKPPSSSAASALLLITMLTWMVVGAGLLLLDRLPKVSGFVAEFTITNRIMGAMVATTMFSSLVIPRIYDYIYRLLDHKTKGDRPTT